MGISREDVISKEWVLRFTALGRVIVLPYTVVRSGVYFLLICALFVYAYNTGQETAVSQVKVATYLYTLGCNATAVNNQIVFECPHVEQRPYPFDSPLLR